MTEEMKRYKPAEGEVVTVRLLKLPKDGEGLPPGKLVELTGYNPPGKLNFALAFRDWLVKYKARLEMFGLLDPPVHLYSESDVRVTVAMYEGLSTEKAGPEPDACAEGGGKVEAPSSCIPDKESIEWACEAAHARRMIFAGLGVPASKDPPPPTECGACERPFDAYRKRFGYLCGDCVPKANIDRK